MMASFTAKTRLFHSTKWCDLGWNDPCIDRIKNSNRPLVSNGIEVLESRYKNRIKRYEMMEYKISNENVKDTTSKVLEIMETQNA